PLSSHDHVAARCCPGTAGQADGAIRRAAVSRSCEMREPGVAYAARRARRPERGGVDRMKQLPVVQPSTSPPSERSSDDRSTGARSLQTAGMVADPEATAALGPQIVAALSTVFDPEIPVNIYELGLVYDIIVDAERRVGIRMTLTAPACPAAQSLPAAVKKAVAAIPTVSAVMVDLVRS